MEERIHQIVRGELAGLSELRGSKTELSETILYVDTVKATWKNDEEISFASIAGKAIVTTERIVFVANVEVEYDASIDAECILLHATLEDPPSIYLQIQETSAEVEAPMELTIVPDEESSCYALFEALSKLVAMHPIYDDDIDDGDEGMVFLGTERVENDEVVTEDRQAMLDRLDDLLEVPPYLDVGEGQFDDADELL